MSAVLYHQYGYQAAFAVLVVPALLSLAVLVTARFQFPRPGHFDRTPPAVRTRGYSSRLDLHGAGGFNRRWLRRLCLNFRLSTE